ncbi:MAG: heme A synthase [Deltaproteobacteria bacterium]|nr:heme A synthase [Deltaproteobacteria bacterium]
MLEHRIAKLAAAATFLLLVIGGTVNPTGSSLACPEPTLVCNGELFPEMTGGVFYEHGHRLAAMTVGLLQLVLTFLLFRRRERHGTYRLGWILLFLVLLQGALGAITVEYKLPWMVSTGHLLLGMSYFAALIYTTFRTRPAPSVVELQRHETLRTELGAARKWILIAVSAVFVQLLFGALVRHWGAALVCPDMPSCSAADGFWPEAAIQKMHMIHRGFGIVVAVVTTVSAVMVLRAAKSWAQLRLLALFAPLVVVGQVALGVMTVLSMRSVPIAVGHFAGAAALWAIWISMWLMTSPLVRRRGSGGKPEAVAL